MIRRSTSDYYGEFKEISKDIAFLSDGDEVTAGEWKSLVMAWLGDNVLPEISDA